MVKLVLLLLALGIHAPDWCYGSDGAGRAIEGLEFPFTAIVKRTGNPEPVCMGIISSSVTVITAAMCDKAFQYSPVNVSGIVIEPSDNTYGKSPNPLDVYDVEEGHKDPRNTVSKLVYVALRLVIPGIMLEPGRTGRSLAITNDRPSIALKEDNEYEEPRMQRPAWQRLGRYQRKAQEPTSTELPAVSTIPSEGGDTKTDSASTSASEERTSPEARSAAAVFNRGTAPISGDAVVPCLDKKVVGVKILDMEACRSSYLNLVEPKSRPERDDADRRGDQTPAPASESPKPSEGGDTNQTVSTSPASPEGGKERKPDEKREELDFAAEDFGENMVCVQKAAAEVPLAGGKGVPPGQPCSKDVGAPLVDPKDKKVLGVLLFAWCSNKPEDMAIFVRNLDDDKIEVVPSEDAPAEGPPSPPPGPEAPPEQPGSPPGQQETTVPPRGGASSTTPIFLLSTVFIVLFSLIHNAGQ